MTRQAVLETLRYRLVAAEELIDACTRSFTGKLLNEAFDLEGTIPPDLKHLMGELDKLD